MSLLLQAVQAKNIQKNVGYLSSRDNGTTPNPDDLMKQKKRK